MDIISLAFLVATGIDVARAVETQPEFREAVTAAVVETGEKVGAAMKRIAATLEKEQAEQCSGKATAPSAAHPATPPISHLAWNAPTAVAEPLLSLPVAELQTNCGCGPAWS